MGGHGVRSGVNSPSSSISRPALRLVKIENHPFVVGSKETHLLVVLVVVVVVVTVVDIFCVVVC